MQFGGFSNSQSKLDYEISVFLSQTTQNHLLLTKSFLRFICNILFHQIILFLYFENYAITMGCEATYSFDEL